MKKYTVKDGENFGSIAVRFGLPSWKYLYELNKDAVGENPDLMEAGTKLDIPEWDSTGGDEKIEEKIKEKDAKPFSYTGGMRYRYPWVPYSITVADKDDRLLEESSDSYKFSLIDTSQEPEKVLIEKTFSQCDEISFLVPLKDGAKEKVEIVEEKENE